MSRRLILAVEIPDDASLVDVAQGVRESFERATARDADDRDSGRVRVPFVSEAIGGWKIVDVDETASGDHGWSVSPLVDRITAVHLPDGRVQITSECGADPADDEATPDEGFADVVLDADEVRPIALALAAWTLR